MDATGARARTPVIRLAAAAVVALALTACPEQPDDDPATEDPAATDLEEDATTDE